MAPLNNAARVRQRDIPFLGGARCHAGDSNGCDEWGGSDFRSGAQLFTRSGSAGLSEVSVQGVRWRLSSAVAGLAHSTASG